MIRVGIGYDVHPFQEGRPLVLGGVAIPHSQGLKGHSDADVLCHAIADAVLGAMGEPDIGYYFPPSDPTIEGISSLKILEKCAALAAGKGMQISNVDASLIAEAPRVMPHAARMKEHIAGALGITPGQVGIKATTNERLGFIGREEGIAAMAFIPLVSAGRVIGKFMLYSDTPRELTVGELQLASVIAGQVAFAVTRVRAEDAARHAEAQARR